MARKSASKSVRAAARLYKKFREEPPKRAKRITLDIPSSLMVMGYVSGIEYETTHLDDERKKRQAQGYRHKFAPGSRPLLCAAPGKNNLFLIGGRYHVTDRGIVDLTPQGREIED